MTHEGGAEYTRMESRKCEAFDSSRLRQYLGHLYSHPFFSEAKSYCSAYRLAVKNGSLSTNLWEDSSGGGGGRGGKEAERNWIRKNINLECVSLLLLRPMVVSLSRSRPLVSDCLLRVDIESDRRRNERDTTRPRP